MEPRELLAFLRERLAGGRKNKSARTIRKTSHLNLEHLETRLQPAASTSAAISGYVFLDANNNGIYDARVKSPLPTTRLRCRTPPATLSHNNHQFEWVLSVYYQPER